MITALTIKAHLTSRVIGPLEQHCSGCPLEPSAAYVTVPFIGIGVCTAANSECPTILERTIAFDRAECDSANISQTNLITVSSFNGPQGLLLGHDILRQKRHPNLDLQTPGVYWADPLFEASKALFGTVRDKRFPISPGQHLLCAAKSFVASGPMWVYGAMAIGIAEDRDTNADLFMEDHGIFGSDDVDEQALVLIRRSVQNRLVDAVHTIGDNLGVRYPEVYVGIRSRWINQGEIACVLTAAPYVHLARKAVPWGNPEALAELSLHEWEDEVKSHFLTR